MGIDAVMGLVVGRAYDRFKEKNKNTQAGLLTLVFIPLLTALIIPMAFSYNVLLIMGGMVFWGVVMGSHETIMKASIADITPIKKRGTAYGVFNVIYGLAMFAGSACVGYMYDVSIQLMIVVLVLIEIISIPVFL